MSILGIDVGTTGCKAEAFSREGRRYGTAYREYGPDACPAPDELDPRVVWRLTREVIREAASHAGKDPVTALCVSSMGEAMVAVTERRELLGNSILSSDGRGSEHAERLKTDFDSETFYRINPNIPGAGYSLPKLLWMREHEPVQFDRADHMLLWADLVGFMLGGEPRTALSLANRTLLLDLHREDWSEHLLSWSGLPREKLAPVAHAGEDIGCVCAEEADALGLPRDVRIVVGGHDQCCNSLGAGIYRAGEAVCGIGTYECITPTYDRLPEARAMLACGLNIEHHLLPGLYVSFLYNQGGALVKWFRDTFAASEMKAGDKNLYDKLAAEMPPQPTGLFVLPYFMPSGPPDFVAHASGVLSGLRTSTTRGEILKAIMECETLYFLDGIQSLRALGADTSAFLATGGGARSDAWLQIKADIFGVPFIRPEIEEGSLLGAAMMAGLATGVFDSPAEATACFVRRARRFEPDPARHAEYRQKHAAYRELREKFI